MYINVIEINEETSEMIIEFDKEAEAIIDLYRTQNKLETLEDAILAMLDEGLKLLKNKESRE